MRELLLEIWASVRKNKLRTFLTGFSVAWGIFMLVILLGSGTGLKNGVTSNFGSMNINTIHLYGGYTSMPWHGYEKWRRIQMTNSDIEILQKEFPEVDQIGANTWAAVTATFEGAYLSSLNIGGTMPQNEAMDGIEMTAGRYINEADLAQQRKVIVLNEEAQTVLFHGADPLGKQIDLNGMLFTVIGVNKGGQRFGGTSNFIPLTTAQLIYRANSPFLDRIIFSVKGISTDQQSKEFEKRIRTRLAAEHNFSPDDESAIWVANTMEQYKNMMVVFGGINLFIWIIGLGTLLAGVVGVSNIMLVTVQERTFEFGIRKALGAKPSSIIRLILTEAVLITAAFGYIGMVLGVYTMELVNKMLSAPTTSGDGPQFNMFLNPTLNLSVAVSATIVLIIAGLVAGYVPARRAAQLKTIDALRHNR